MLRLVGPIGAGQSEKSLTIIVDTQTGAVSVVNETCENLKYIIFKVVATSTEGLYLKPIGARPDCTSIL